MKKLSMSLLADTISTQRKEKALTQKQLSELTGINRTMISRLEKEDYLPSIQQLETLAEVLDFEPTTMFVEESTKKLDCPIDENDQIESIREEDIEKAKDDFCGEQQSKT